MAVRLLTLLVALILTAPGAHAQAAPVGPRILVVTIGPGDAVWERFGHNAIWVQDPARGVDVAYNYGMFDFGQANFFVNFARGRMLYWMAGMDPYLSLEHYAGQNREIWIQELELEPGQATALAAFLANNALPENREYRYDYYRDNCSTRVRDALDQALGGSLRAATVQAGSGATYRWHTARLIGGSAADAPIHTGILAGLGPAADREITRWEEMFLPMKLRDRLAEQRVRTADGRQLPLVRSTRIIPAARPAEPAAPRAAWLTWHLAAGVLAGGVLAGLATIAGRGRAARFGYAAGSALWTLFAGTGGLILLGLWLLTDHAIAYRNENLLQLSPLALPLALLLPAAAYGARWAAKPARTLSAAVGALSVLGLVIQVLPGVDQGNGIVIALALPINLALAWAARETTAE